jgi:hypothetical protein
MHNDLRGNRIRQPEIICHSHATDEHTNLISPHNRIDNEVKHDPALTRWQVCLDVIQHCLCRSDAMHSDDLVTRLGTFRRALVLGTCKVSEVAS